MTELLALMPILGPKPKASEVSKKTVSKQSEKCLFTSLVFAEIFRTENYITRAYNKSVQISKFYTQEIINIPNSFMQLENG